MTECEDGTNCPKNTKLLERIARLEVATEKTFDQLAQNVKLAREIVDKDREETKLFIQSKFESFNQWQHRFDRLEGELARKGDLEKEVKIARQFTDQALDTARELNEASNATLSDRINLVNLRIGSIERLVWIGVGVVVSVQFVFHFLK